MTPRPLTRLFLTLLALCALLRGAAAQNVVTVPILAPLGSPAALPIVPTLSFVEGPQAPEALPIAPALDSIEGLAPLSAAPIAAHPLRLLITGPPGVGKTTFGKMLARDYGMVHISVGELLRAKAANDPALAEKMSQGELVDSELVRQVVSERLAQDDVQTHGFILDGFPRRPEEINVIESWLENGGHIDAMIHLEAPDSELLRRINARGRMDDSPEVFAKRMEIYRNQTQPVLTHFGKTLPVLEPATEGSDIESNYAQIRALIEGLAR